MGLDITAYRNFRPVQCVEKDGDALDPVTKTVLDDARHVSANRDFPTHAENVDGWVDGKEAEMGFRAGSYSSYNAWREQLAKMAGYPAILETSGMHTGAMRHDAGAYRAGGGPFHEMIWFSDCEGVIGPKKCAKLANDFAQFQAHANKEDEYFRDLYAKWRKAFEIAAHNGFVHFH